jgi:hypothetical protein
MFKKILLPVLFFVTIINITAADEKYGKEITLKEKTPLSAILSSTDKYEGKTVLVEGKIVGVCQDKGCWIDIAGEKENEKIKVKVEDGEIVFPKDAKGKTVLVQGIVVPVAEPTCEMETSCGSGAGGCCSKNKKEKVYQIKGLGAVIK